MSPNDKLAVIGHNGWAARSIIKALASQPFTHPIRVLVREGSNADALPRNTEIVRYSWANEASIANSLEGIDVLLYFISHSSTRIAPANVQQIFHWSRRLVRPEEADHTHEKWQIEALRAVRSGTSLHR